MKRARFKPSAGPLALLPAAFGEMFDAEPESEVQSCDGVAIVTIRGPLMHHGSFWFDSYESIVGRVGAALETRPRALVLCIDSPGGLVAGLFEAATEIEAMCASCSVPVHAYVEGMAASAAYGLASIAETITIPSTGHAGSVGVIDALVDRTASNAQIGLRVDLITSGARKADGNPDQPISDEAKARAQARVMQLAAIFFDHVATRRGLSVEQVQALEADLFTGTDAISAGLADRIGTLDELVASLASGGALTAQATTETTMEENEKAARLALEAIIADEKADEKAKGRAKRALAAMDDAEDPPKPDCETETETSASAARVAQLEGELAALRCAADEMRAQLESTPSEDERREADERAARAAIVDKAIGEGRIAKASREKWLSIAEKSGIDATKAAFAAMPARRMRIVASAESAPDRAEIETESDAKKDAKRLLSLVAGSDAGRIAARIK